MNKKNTILILISLVLVCLLAPLTFKIAGIPFRLQSLIVFLPAAVLGKRDGSIIAIAYLILGALGLPIFSGFMGGWEKLTGPTAGFLWSMPLVAYYLGWECERGVDAKLMRMIYFFRAHLLWLVAGFAVLSANYEGMDLMATIVRIIPDVLLKSILGGVLSVILTGYVTKFIRP